MSWGADLRQLPAPSTGTAGGDRRRPWFVVALLSAAVFLASSCSDRPPPKPGDTYPDGVSPALIEEGRQVFAGEGGCHVCHGPDARGARGVGANLRDREWWHSGGSFGELVELIAAGVPGDQARNLFKAAMPPRGGSGIDDDALRAVAAFVWSFRLLPDSTAPLADGAPAGNRGEP